MSFFANSSSTLTTLFPTIFFAKSSCGSQVNTVKSSGVETSEKNKGPRRRELQAEIGAKMGRKVTLACCALNQWSLDFEGNMKRILESKKSSFCVWAVKYMYMNM